VATALAGLPRRDERRVSFTVLDEQFDVRPHAYDLVAVPDLGSFGDKQELVAQSRTLVSGRGCVLLAVRDADGSVDSGRAGANLNYYDLYDLISAEFASVRMLGRAPFTGYTIADFAAAGEPPVTIDTSLVEVSEHPDWFIALGSDQPLEVDPYTLVQVPAVDGRSWLTGADSPADGVKHAEAHQRAAALNAELEQCRRQHEQVANLAAEREAMVTALSTHAAELEAELDQLISRRDALEARGKKEADRLRRQVENLSRQLAAEQQRPAETERNAEENLRTQLEQAQAQIAELEAAAPASLASEQESSSPAGPAEVRRYEFQIGELKKSLATARNERDEFRDQAQKSAKLEAELAQQRRARRDTERKLQARQAQPATDEDCAREISALEDALRQRGQQIASLQADLRESERIGRELVAELDARTSGTAPSGAERPPVQPLAAAAAPAPAVGPGPVDDRTTEGQSPAHQRQLELLAQKCSQVEADLEAANWTISGLRNQLAKADPSDRTSDQAKLEGALEEAQRQLAELRSQLGRDSEPPQ